MYRCPNCGQERPRPEIAAEAIELDGTRGAAFTLRTQTGSAPIRLPLPGLYNVYNALAAASLCLSLGMSLEQVADGLQTVTAAFGRAETVRIGEVEVSTLLVKNPAGANEIMRTLVLEDDELDLLAILNDRTADGRDVSWVWDADFEIIAPRLRHAVCAGTRAAELALRLKYAGTLPQRLEVVADLPQALDRALAATAQDRLYVLPTYTALLELREELARRGHVDPFWERRRVAAR